MMIRSPSYKLRDWFLYSCRSGWQLHHRRSICSPSPTTSTVGYVTDIEGNYGFWQRYIDLSQVLRRNETTKDIELKNERCHFVFGGDLWDRGPGDMRVLGDLLRLKRRYPERVHFVLGNRDLNKLRLLAELSLASRCFPPRLYIYPQQYSIEENSPLSTPDSEVDRLRWILAKTMGCPFSFQHRKDELKVMGEDHSDEAVVCSYLSRLRPGGQFISYLSQSSLAVKLFDILFVHGSISAHNFGWIAGQEKVNSQNLSLFISSLNKFLMEETVDYINNIEGFVHNMGRSNEHWGASGGYDHLQPGRMGSLPGGVKNRTVVYSSYVDHETSKPIPPDPEFSSFLVDEGINKIVVGHKPQGDAPLLMQCSYGLKVMMGDSSYAKSGTRWPGKLSEVKNYSGPIRGDTRGNVTSEIVFSIDNNEHKNSIKSNVFIHGICSDGQNYAFDWNDDSEFSDYLGLKTKDDWWVKGIMENYDSTYKEKRFLLSKSKGFDVYNKYIGHSELARKFVEFRA